MIALHGTARRRRHAPGARLLSVALLLAACQSGPDEEAPPSPLMRLPPPTVKINPIAVNQDQYFQPVFNKPAFLEAHPELDGRVFTVPEFWDRAHLGAAGADPQGPIRIGEQVRFWIEGDSTFDVTVTISDAGFVDLPYAGPVTVVGRTPAEAQAELAPKLATLYRTPPRVVKLVAAGAAAPRPPSPAAPARGAIDAAGELQSPLAAPPVEQFTLARAMETWGPSKNANLRTVWVFREIPEAGGKRIGIVADLVKLQQNDLHQDIGLLPGDVVFVTGIESKDAALERNQIRARTEYLLGRIGREDFVRELRGGR